jgi:hypothetical protein
MGRRTFSLTNKKNIAYEEPPEKETKVNFAAKNPDGTSNKNDVS